jgi:hypothetical protein
VTFRIGQFSEVEFHRVRIDIPRVVISGCKQITEGRQATERLGSRQTVFQQVEWPPHLEGLHLEADEKRLLDLVDGRRTLYDLCEEGPMTQGLNARVVYALWALGMIGRDREESGPIRIQVGSTSG